MDLSFNRVNYDGDLSDFSEDELRELVQEYETAQDSNVAEFEKAAEATQEIDDSTIEDFESARAALIEDITEAEDFDEVPLTEEKLEDEDFSDLQEWRDFVLSDAGDDGGPDGDDDDEGGFEDFGQEGEVNSEDGEVEEFVERELGSVQGLNI